jgi:hypothetical protein
VQARAGAANLKASRCNAASPCTLSPPQLERTRTCRSDATRWRAPTPTLPALSQLAARSSQLASPVIVRVALWGCLGLWCAGPASGPLPYAAPDVTNLSPPYAACRMCALDTVGPPCPGRRGRRGRRLFPVVWRMTQSRQAGVDCSGRAHVNFASNRASVGSGHRTPVKAWQYRHSWGSPTSLPRNSSTQPLNHSTTQHLQATPHATLICLPWIAAPTTTYCSYQHHRYPLHKSAERTVTRHCSCSPSPNQDACTMSVIGPSSPPTPRKTCVT